MIKKVSIENFKAIQSTTLALKDLNVFVGNNGSGKSSVIEALQTLQNVLLKGIANGFTDRWFGLEKIQNNSTQGKPFTVRIEGTLDTAKYTYQVSFGTSENKDIYFISAESLSQDKAQVFEVKEGRQNDFLLAKSPHTLSKKLYDYISSWQFLSLEPEQMYFPTSRNQGSAAVRMDSSGRNLADIFSRLQDDAIVFDIITDKMRYVLPDLADFSTKHDGFRKEVFLQMVEQSSKEALPSWLFSSGTLRILAILTLLNSKAIPSLILIEEIENGLDPRTLNMLVDELQRLLPKVQFVITTHSPYFLDLLDLEHVIVAERVKSKTKYFRPASDEKLVKWKEKFSVGKLYTMNKLISS